MHSFIASLPLLLLIVPALEGQSPVVQECHLSAVDTSAPPAITEEIQRIGGLTASTAAALRLCGDSTKWMALVNLPNRDVGDERGWRVALFVDSAGGPRVRYVTTGLIDSYQPEFRLFRSGREHLLLLGLGDEGGSWGMATFDVGPFQVVPLGNLDLGIPPTADDVDNDQSALSAVHVTRRVEGWQVGFRRSVVLHPNQDRRRVITPARDHQLLFRPGGEWQQLK